MHVTPNAVELTDGGDEGIVVLVTADSFEIRLATIDGRWEPMSLSPLHAYGADWLRTPPTLNRAVR